MRYAKYAFFNKQLINTIQFPWIITKTQSQDCLLTVQLQFDVLIDDHKLNSHLLNAISLRKFFARQTFEHQISARRTSVRQCCHCRLRTPTETVFIIYTYIYKFCFIVIRCIIGAYREYGLVCEWNKLVRPRVAATT